MNLNAALSHAERGHGLDAEINGGNGKALGAHGIDHVRLDSRHLISEVRAFHPRSCLHPRQQLGIGCLGITAAEQTNTHAAALAKMSGQRPGVDLADADNALSDQIELKISISAPVRGHPRGVTHDITRNPDSS